MINDLNGPGGSGTHEVLDGMVTPNVGVKLKTLMDVPTGVESLAEEDGPYKNDKKRPFEGHFELVRGLC